MTLTYNQNEIDLLNRKWIRLGWMVAGDIFEGDIDIEELIVETTVKSRQDGRLFKWFLTWVRDYNDLINVKRLLRIIEKADTAVLGVVFDIAMEYGANPNLRTITKKCPRKALPEILFTGMEDVFTFIDQEKKHGLPVYKKWGFYCTLLEFYEDARRTREWVLQQNTNLALRALFGPNIRAEIIFCILKNTDLAIKNIARKIGYAYSPVYNEIENLVKSGFVIREKGRWHSLQLSKRTEKIITVFY
jgi:predicted transcriptional regulator